jgi:hypothetical protein
LFKEHNGQSRIDVTQENFHDEHAIKPHQDGWEDALESLKAYLSNGKEG